MVLFDAFQCIDIFIPKRIITSFFTPAALTIGHLINAIHRVMHGIAKSIKHSSCAIDEGIISRCSRLEDGVKRRRWKWAKAKARKNICALKSEGISKLDRIIPDIGVGIHPAREPHRVGLDIAPEPRIVVPEDVVVQAGFRVEILPRQAQVIGEAAEPLGVGVGGVGAEGIGQVPAPAQLLSRAEDLARGAQVVAVDVVDGAAGAVTATGISPR
jgi:hypothetical protein